MSIKKGVDFMHFLEFKRRMNLLTAEEKKYIYQLSLIDAINYLKSKFILS